MTTYHLFDAAPSLLQSGDEDDVSLGTEFIVTAQCWVTQFRWLRPINGVDGGIRQAALYLVNGTRVVEPVDLGIPAQGEWGATDLPTPYKLAPGRYKVVVRHPLGRYPAQLGWFAAGGDEVKGPVTVPHASNATSGNQGSFGYGSGMVYPDGSYQSAAYFSDVTVTDEDPNPPVSPTDADVLLSVGEVRGYPLTFGSPHGSPLVVLPPTGHPLTPTEATL